MLSPLRTNISNPSTSESTSIVFEIHHYDYAKIEYPSNLYNSFDMPPINENQGKAMKSSPPPWTILWFRILGIFSVENIPYTRHYNPRFVYFLPPFYIEEWFILQTIYVLKTEILHFFKPKIRGL